jgi:alcohol dehydrogenase (cytochrome c)
MKDLGNRPVAAGVGLVLAASLAAAGCASPGQPASQAKPARQSRLASLSSLTRPAGTCTQAASAPVLASSLSRPGLAAGWTLPGANLQNTRDVASPINSANVSRLGVAWTVPISSASDSAGTAGDYAATPVVVGGVVYTQDLDSDVMAISLATGKVLWTHDYNSPNGGPDGVNVVGGTVYAATASAAVALQASTGRQLWSRTLIRSDHEGIDMAPGYNHGTVYVSTVPVNVANAGYTGGGQAVLWALDARTGAPRWSWDEVQNLWGNPAINSGGGQWDPPSFDRQGNLYIGVSNPGPLGGAPGYPWGTSRPGPDLYTDSVVKLSPQGKLLWYYQLTPHDLYDWDLQNSPMLTTAGGQQVVVDGGKGGIMIELSARTGKLLWKRPVGEHNGHDNDGLRTEFLTPAQAFMLPAQTTVAPGGLGGIESQLATNGRDAFAAVVNFPFTELNQSGPYFPSTAAFDEAIAAATGEMVAVSQATGRVEWDVKLPSAPYGGAATVTNNVVFTTTLKGYLYAFNAATGAVLLKTPLSAWSNAPVAVDGDYVIVGAGLVAASTQQPLIIAYKLGAKGTLPDTVCS